jgi:hypothetical protein
MASLATTADVQVALRFSNYFGINKAQSELDFVDILLDTDIKLYLDPFALSIEEDEWSKQCNNLVVGYFQEVVDSIGKKDFHRAQQLLSNLREPNQTRLGLSQGHPRGRGIGPKQAFSLYSAFADSKAIESGLLTDLSECELFIDRIGHDKISDVTTNIIRRKLIEFTQEQCRRWKVAMQDGPVGPCWDQDNLTWRSAYAELPIYKGYPLILVPKRSVRYKMSLDSREFYDMDVTEFIRRNFNQAEHLKPGAGLWRILRAGMKATKHDVQDDFPMSKAFLREFSEAHPEVLARYKRKAKRPSFKWLSDEELFNRIRSAAHSQNMILVEEVRNTTCIRTSSTVTIWVQSARAIRLT